MVIRAGRFAAPGPPEGLSGPAGELPWLGLSLAARQERAFVRAKHRFDGALLVGDGASDAGGDGLLLVREDAAITAGAVTALAERGAAEGRDVAWRAGGRIGSFAAELGFGDEGPLLVYLAPGGAVTLARVAAAEPVEIDPAERLMQVPVPRSQFGADLVELPATDRLVLPCGHWLQLLWANLLGMAPHLWRELVGRSAVQAVARLAWAILRAGSIEPGRVGARLGRQGKGCRVHPSAVVEMSWLGDGVEVGPGAVVRGAVLGDGAVVEEQALVTFSVLAPTARVQRQALVKYSVLRERCAVAGAMQLGVADRESAVKYGAVLMDMALSQGVRVSVGGRLVNAPLGLAGVCVGAGTLVGSGVAVAPGRALPPGLQIVPGGDSLVQVIPPGLSGAVAVRGGRLEPL